MRTKYMYMIIIATSALVGMIGPAVIEPVSATAGSQPIPIAHRGAWSAKVDENTIQSLNAAHKLKAWSEHDVFITADNKFAVVHNKELRHTTDCTGLVTDKTLAEVQQCRTQPNNQAVPSLEQLLAALAKNKGQRVNLELKGSQWVAGEQAVTNIQALDALLASYKLRGRVYISPDAQKDKLLEKFTAYAPNVKLCWKPAAADGPINVAEAQKRSVDAIMMNAKDVTAGKVKNMRKAGLQVWARLTNSKPVWNTLKKQGVQAILTDKAGYL